jgi:N-acetylmuramoyl-L-alanine amidase
MFIKLTWRFVASGALLLCIGCGSTEESKCCDPGSAPVCTPTCATPPANEASAATRDRLIRKPSLTGPEKLALGDALRDLGEYNSAETSYFGALSRGGLSPDESYRAQMGLARCADAQNQNYSARARYKDAWKLAPNDAAKDRALIALTEVELEDGDVKSAREHRKAITNAGYVELAEIDRRLGVAERPAAVVAYDSGGGARPSGRGFAPPKINGRETWKARPMSMRGEPEPMGKINRVTLHHTADARPVGSSYAAVADRVKAYQTGHQQTNHWADIGYHFVIDRQGRIWEGRELSWKGAHAGNKQANENNVGIALIGNFENADPPAAQRESAEELVAWLAREYGISSSKIYGHGEIEKLYGIPGTCCPGKRFGPTLAGIKRAADRARGGAAAGAN